MDESQPLQARACEKAGYDRRERSPIASQKTCITPVLCGAGWYVQRAVFLLFVAVYGRNRMDPLISSYLKSAYFFRKYAGPGLAVSFLFRRTPHLLYANFIFCFNSCLSKLSGQRARERKGPPRCYRPRPLTYSPQ